MITRPEAIGLTVRVLSVEDADAVLHEIAWLNGFEQQVEANYQALLEDCKKRAQDELVVTIDGVTMTVDERRKELAKGLQAWCDDGNLKAALPANKRTLKLSHGEMKMRALPAAVALTEGATPDDVARSIAREAGLLALVDDLLSSELEGVALSKLLTIKFALNKDAIKDEAEKRPEFVEFLQARKITIEQGGERTTFVPAALQVTTVAESV